MTWPTQFGGRRMTPAHQIVFNQELARYDATSGFITAAQALVGPTLMHHGSPEQQQRYLEPLLSGEESWCQLFSEPGAGSDLSALATRAVRDGDDWVVTGQKVWNSSAQHADFGILIARTDPDVPKHDGLTFFIVDMRAGASTCGRWCRPRASPTSTRCSSPRSASPLRTWSARSAAGGRSPRTTLRNESSMISGAGLASTFATVLSTARRCRSHR